MKISIILAHPDKQSFNHAIADAAVRARKERFVFSAILLKHYGKAVFSASAG
jgi:putative NADPH-quinone reductase